MSQVDSSPAPLEVEVGSARYGWPLLRGDLAGGLTATLLTIPGAMSLGILAFAALGPEYAGAGIMAALLALIVGNAVAALLPAVRCQVVGSRASTTAVVGAFVATLAAHPALQTAAGPDVTRIMALVALVVAVSGALQAAFGVAGLGHAVKFVPYPVVSGFMNGIAVMIIIAQLRPALGLAGTAPLGITLAELGHAHFGSVAVAIATFGAVFVADRFNWRVPPVVVGLGTGIAAHYLIAFLSPASAGALVGTAPPDLPAALRVGEYWSTWVDADPSLLLKVVLPAAVLLAAVSSLEGLLSAVVVDSATRGQHDGNRVLASQGAANVAVAIFGALPVAGYANTPAASYRAGGRTPLATLFLAALILCVLLTVSPWVARVPVAALAGLMMFFAVTMIDRWSRDLVMRLGGPHGRTERVVNVGIVVGVAAAQAMLNVVVALAIGVVASVALMLVKLSGTPVRRHLDGTRRSSLKVRSAEAREALKPLAPRIRILELEGELFFGTADRLQREVDTLPPDTCIAILDLRRIHEIDATGARVLDVIAQRAQQRNICLVLSHVGEEDPRGQYLRALGIEESIPKDRWFPDLDRALEWAEEDLLHRARHADPENEVPLERLAILRDLDADDLAQMRSVLQRLELREGEPVFREGESGDHMYFIARGTVSINVALEGEKRAVRLATFSPGVVFGEMSLLQGERRSADAFASAPNVVLYSLGAAALEKLMRDDPALGMRIHRNIARELASRLRATSRALRALE